MATSTTRRRSTAAVIASTVLAGGLAATALGSAPTAAATCASFFGLGNTADCSSTITSVAVAIGPNAKAYAQGWFGSALAIGTSNEARTDPGSVLTNAITLGDYSYSRAGGILSLAVEAGTNSGVQSGLNTTDVLNIGVALGNSSGSVSTYGALNLGVTLFGSSTVVAAGVGNSALNVTGANSVYAIGRLNSATNLFGTSNSIQAGGNPTATLNSVANVGGSNNTVVAGPGPVAISIALLRSGSTITKSGPGLNINGVVVGGAAAVSGKKATKAPSSKSTAAPHNRSTGGSARK